ncbi:VOC family protein [Saccharopolyspora halophila]|uniref:VOC family protein n=1 Tax=Saccharopolyspora halophila TaxID=405551 RepID=A0ABN3G5F3_9PSEU
MADNSRTGLLPILHYDDTRSAVQFLTEVLGFRQEVAASDAEGDIVHAELAWPGGGALVIGGTKHTDGVHGRMRAGNSAIYLATDEVDLIHDRAREAGAEIAEAPHRATFGSGTESYVCTVRDPECNLWTIGTYRSG